MVTKLILLIYTTASIKKYSYEQYTLVKTKASAWINIVKYRSDYGPFYCSSAYLILSHHLKILILPVLRVKLDR